MKIVYVKPKPWFIQDEKTNKYFSMLGSLHFTDNIEIAQQFNSERDAIICEENHIHCSIDFLQYYTIPVQL
jgi:hypothetical protein